MQKSKFSRRALVAGLMPIGICSAIRFFISTVVELALLMCSDIRCIWSLLAMSLQSALILLSPCEVWQTSAQQNNVLCGREQDLRIKMWFVVVVVLHGEVTASTVPKAV